MLLVLASRIFCSDDIMRVVCRLVGGQSRRCNSLVNRTISPDQRVQRLNPHSIIPRITLPFVLLLLLLEQSQPTAIHQITIPTLHNTNQYFKRFGTGGFIVVGEAVWVGQEVVRWRFEFLEGGGDGEGG